MSRNSAEIRRRKERKSIATTIGYCFVIVLVVLLVMSKTLTDTYTVVLESERAEAMESISVACSTALGHTNIEEGMTFPLPVYEYAKGKPYTFDIYTKAGNSFLRLCTTSENSSIEQYYLSGVGDYYNNCFELQQSAFTTRTDDGIKYVCAIAPIISAENTVAGILEVRMPYSDFVSTVNGMSLSWVFTIISIAVAMGIIIYELNLFVSTVSRGISGNVPVIIMYGKEAVSFLSFFASLGAVMIPVIIPLYVKDCLPDYSYSSPIVQSLIALGIILYAFGFFGGSAIRRELKFKLTSRIALIVTNAIGYMFSLLAGIVDLLPVTLVLILFTGFAYGMAFNVMRDYRMNAGRLGYEEYSDRKIHNVQYTGYFLGIAVGTVIAGICYERFGLLIVNVIAGAVMIIASLGIVFFMRDNQPVKESYFPITRWLELMSDKYAGRFLASSFLSMGVLVAFMLCFLPNYLPTVGISLATASFYYLVATFAALFLGYIIKERYAYAMTSRVRVLLSSFSSLLGLLLFALVPTAKMLFVTSALVGLGLGIHDFYYLYVLYLLTNSRFKNKYNLRRACEISFVTGGLISVPVYMLALMFDIRIVFIVALVIYFIVSFLYPLSQYSSQIDERDPQLKRKKKVKEAVNPDPIIRPSVEVTPEIVMAVDGQMPEGDMYVQDPMAVPTSNLDVNSFIDDLADSTQGGYYNGPLE